MNNADRKDRGLAYIADKKIIDDILKCRKLLQQFNTSDWTDLDTMFRLTKEILGKSEGAIISPPFMCDFGFNIECGKNFYANCNCIILDVAKVKFGDNCFLGPNVGVYTAGHPIHPTTRNSGYEYGKEITVGDNVWIGGNSTICPGVHIGSNVVIGAGSVVTKDIPDWCIAAGNPCRVIRLITEDDRKKLFRYEEIDMEAWKDIVERGYSE